MKGNLMKVKNIFKNYFFPFIFLGGLLFFVGCQDNSVETTPQTTTTDKQAVIDVVEADSLIASFEPNYNEDGTITYLSKSNAEIKPLRVWQKMNLTNKNVDISFDADTAYAHITKTFEGTLFISGTNNLTATKPDTLIKKSVTSIITRNAVLVNISKVDTVKHWVVKAVSLPEGGTEGSNVNITKLTVFLPGGDTLSITSPNDYYLVRRWGWHWWRWHNVPCIQRNKDVTIQIELTSAYADTDFVSLTFGADRFGSHRSKKLFDLVSSTANGGEYDKVYEQTFRSNVYPGYSHAIINAFPKQAIYDDSTSVELSSWGVPYFVKF
jgi:hypothetical protein